MNTTNYPQTMNTNYNFTKRAARPFAAHSSKKMKETKQQTVAFPRNKITNIVHKIREFDDCQQLYYYLTWTCKMQMIDGQFMEYRLQQPPFEKISIFNTELHGRKSNLRLFIVSVLNEPNDYYHKKRLKWTMDDIMSADEIYKKYSIRPDILPIGSRYKHKYFKANINANYYKLPTNIYISDVNKIKIIKSQRYKHKKPILNDIELNTSIRNSIYEIRNNNLCLIPILTVNMKQRQIFCDALIPIKYNNKWMAISYHKLACFDKTVITGLYIDVDDIINKALLVNVDAVKQYEWLNINVIQTPQQQIPYKQQGIQQQQIPYKQQQQQQAQQHTVTMSLTPLTDDTILEMHSFSNVVICPHSMHLNAKKREIPTVSPLNVSIMTELNDLIENCWDQINRKPIKFSTNNKYEQSHIAY